MRECRVPQEVVGAVVEWQARCLEYAIWKEGEVEFLLGEAYGADRPVRMTRSVRGSLQGKGLMAYYRILFYL